MSMTECAVKFMKSNYIMLSQFPIHLPKAFCMYQTLNIYVGLQRKAPQKQKKKLAKVKLGRFITLQHVLQKKSGNKTSRKQNEKKNFSSHSC
jgi:hypothetical protein